ncbi:hypothetical protein [uncultured Piscinibacter sp.]|uniref:hypothetical protein n=1 Tax=uncultured Piscinibacter sp. TaxID=1131835 RepID=UPI00262F94E4|nr:hypothetical protein [uncultured Piscinibacter sp.]
MKTPLSETQPLSLFLSSRCNDTFLYEGELQPLSVLRCALKKRLEVIKLGGKQVFKVWIHEDESNAAALIDNWEACREKSRNADVFIMLYNGRAGWLGTDSPVKDGVGICHAELSAAFNKSPAKVRSIRLKELVKADAGSPDEAFQDYVRKLKIPGAQVKDGEEVLERAEELAAAIVLGLAREGVGINSSGGYFAGEALEWSRKNFQERRRLMTDAVVGLLRRIDGVAVKDEMADVAAVRIRGSLIGFVCDSIPASMTTAAARELVGQPFLRDHEITNGWDNGLQGPVHVIACQKGVTETQALRQLGFPDAIVVSHPFGVYVADEVQKIQMAFVANCRDETTTKEGVQAFLNWLDDHGEVNYLVQRAADRRRISDFVRALQGHEPGNAKVTAPLKPRKQAR